MCNELAEVQQSLNVDVINGNYDQHWRHRGFTKAVWLKFRVRSVPVHRS